MTRRAFYGRVAVVAQEVEKRHPSFREPPKVAKMTMAVQIITKEARDHKAGQAPKRVERTNIKFNLMRPY
jgi:hypothetical protein